MKVPHQEVTERIVVELERGTSRKLTRDVKLTDGQKLTRAYHHAVKKRRDELRAHYPELLHEIDEYFRGATMNSLPQLTEWTLTKLNAIEVTPNYRPILFNYVCARLSALRERAGLPTFDDPLPDQPDDLFIRIRRHFADTEVHNAVRAPAATRAHFNQTQKE
jgi:hypothetical protein